MVTAVSSFSALFNNVTFKSNIGVTKHHDGIVSLENITVNGTTHIHNYHNKPITLLNSRLNSSAQVSGNNISIRDCEFSPNTDIFAGGNNIWIINSSNIEITRSLFMSSIGFHNDKNSDSYPNPRWDEPGAYSPNISHNAFMGKRALAFSRGGFSLPSNLIAIGRNYFGSSVGSTFLPGYVQQAGFLPANGYAAKADPENAFNVDSPLDKSPLSGKRQAEWTPAFWLNGHIIGQNTIAHASGGLDTTASRVLLKNRPTLLSLDISCTENSLSGVRIYITMDGATVDSNSVTLKRDPQDASAYMIRGGRTTHSFVLPGTSKDSVKVEAYIDANSISGFNKPDSDHAARAWLIQGATRTRHAHLGLPN